MKLYASVDADLKDFKNCVSTLLKLCDIRLSNDKISEYVNDFSETFGSGKKSISRSVSYSNAVVMKFDVDSLGGDYYVITVNF